jgi:hypothetical protein
MARIGLQGLVLVAAASLLGCGGESQPDPRPDREQIGALVQDFFEAAAEDDAEAICTATTAKGRAWATGRDIYEVRRGESIVNARHKRPASMEQCVESGARGADSADLPVAMRNGYRPRVLRLRIMGDTARARIGFTAFRRTITFRQTADGWLIDYFALPVRE